MSARRDEGEKQRVGSFASVAVFRWRRFNKLLSQNHCHFINEEDDDDGNDDDDCPYAAADVDEDDDDGDETVQETHFSCPSA